MKKKGKKRLTKAMAIFLTVFMLIGMMPQAAFAGTITDDSSVAMEEQTDVEKHQTAEEEPEATEENSELTGEGSDESEVATENKDSEMPMIQTVSAPTLLSNDGTPDLESGSGNVYISVSYDGKYIDDKNDNPIVYVPIPLAQVASIDLDAYGLSDYLYDEDGDGTYEITALHLVIYAHENIYGGSWGDVTFTGGAGSSYFQGGIFGFDENLNYYLNGEYPLASAGWGATSDQIVLEAGDFLDIASFSSWDFYMDSNYGFHFFADENGTFTHNYTVETGAVLPVKLVRSYSGMGSGAAVYDEADYTISYGLSYGNAVGTVTTDGSGCASITFPSAGKWYVWAEGGYGLEYPESIVSAPGYAEVTVTENPVDVVKAKIEAIGTPITLQSEAAIKEAREAYEGLTDAQKNDISDELFQKIEVAEEELDRLKKEQADADKVAMNKVVELIEKIGTVNVHSWEKINEARVAYNNLELEQKENFDKDVYSKLEKAETDLQALYDKAAAVDPKAIYDATGSYIAGLGTPSVGSIGGEWMVIDLTRAGYDCPEGYYANVVKYIRENINDKEQLHEDKSTDNSRVILGLTAAGYDVTDVDGHNLLAGLTDMDYVENQGINGTIWALIAFDSHHYEIPEGGDVTREALIKKILDAQHTDGGWTLSANLTMPSDPDITGMALQALAPYTANADVQTAVDNAIECLSKMQLHNGGFPYGNQGSTSESCAQVIVALTSLGINPETDRRFVKNGMSIIDAMCLFAVDGGGFEHVPGAGVNGMATEQAQYALVAYYRFLNGQSSLYDMTDVTIGENPEVNVPSEDDQSSAGKTTGGSEILSNAAMKSITKSAKIGLTANLTEEAQAVIDQIDTFVADVAADLPENAADYSEEQMNSVIDAYKAFMELSDAERLAVEDSDAYKEFSKVLKKIADFHHYDEESGVDMRENGEDVLPWHIRAVIEPKEMTKQQAADVNAALGEDSKVFTMNDIYFIDILSNEEWHPEDIVKVKKPMVHLEDYEHAVIVHIMDDGKIELLEGAVDGDTISFYASSFSLYGIAGTNSDIFGVEENGAAVWPWIAIGALALAAIGYLIYRRKKGENEDDFGVAA